MPILLLVATLLVALPEFAAAHDVSRADAALIADRSGPQFWLYVYLGAKHMITGYDHLLFLVGVVFYLSTLRTVALFVSLFALGHSITLLGGVLAGTQANPHLIDAIIGLSVAYKGFDNLGGFVAFLGARPNEKLAVFGFGLFHGLGLATKLQDLSLSRDGLLANLVGFNVGVELGQLAALAAIVLLLRLVRPARENELIARSINVFLLVAGATLATYQLGLYVVG